MTGVDAERYLEFYYRTGDGENVYVRHWPSISEKPVAIIQVAHGLGETAEYYDDFAKQAVSSGFSVYISEARGHGRTAGNIESPEYSEKAGDAGSNGFDHMRDDLHALTLHIRNEYPGIPVILLGHSMGSVVSALYASQYGHELDGLILTGFPAENPNIEFLLEMIDDEIWEYGLKAPCRNTFAELFKDVGKQFEPMETELDWITGDKEMIEQSLRLPYTYVLFNNAFYQSFLLALVEVYKESNLKAVPKNLPILLLSGELDAITDNGRGTAIQCERFHRSGILNAGYKIYHGRRHSILRESNRNEVAEDILGWIKFELKRKFPG